MTVSYNSARNYPRATTKPKLPTTHPELVDEQGRPIKEPLLVMRSVSVDDARQKLDALYNASPNNPNQEQEER